MSPSPHRIILFDGVCNLCNGFVLFLIRRDRRDLFRYGSLQSDASQTLLKQFGPEHLDVTSIVLLDGENISTESDAVLRIIRDLPGLWSLLFALIIVPKFIRDGVYRIIARYRYRVFGKRDSCMIPAPRMKDKFI